MKTSKASIIPTLVVLFSLAILPACNALPLLSSGSISGNSPSAVEKASPDTSGELTSPSVAQPSSPVGSSADGLLAAYEGTLTGVFNRVNPSVVYIDVVSSRTAVSDQQLPFGLPEGLPQIQEGLGSGFVWDREGHIVTNNHVVEGAQKIQVTFSDGTTLPATLVGADADSDLAVIKVERDANLLQPVELADSTKVQVGELAIAIGNPFGLQNTMTLGIISALGRTLPAGTNGSGRSYSIPNIIQTDAPINPGNSGGVLVDDNGLVIGVTSAIESTSNANAGIGYVIPSEIVAKVVPELIKNGTYQHAYLGISGISLTPDLANASKLAKDQRGVLVAEVTAGSPAAKAGLKGSTEVVEVDSQQLPSGGDVITAINGVPVQKMEDLISYLETSTSVGQKVTLTILRDGKSMELSVTLAARPS